jgi:hypothetical protein
MEWLALFENNMFFFLIAYPILGAGIKYIDAAYDEKTFNKKTALIITLPLATLWAYTMLINPISTTILLAILLGVLIKNKIDNYAHLLGSAIIVTIFIIAIYLKNIELIILPLIFLISAAIIDEVGNDIIDYNKKNLKKNRFRHQFSLYFFGRRYVMKLAILYLIIFGIVELYFLLAMILFDEAYIITDLYSRSKQQKDK